MTNTEPWSITIKKRRLRLFGHILRLPPNIPVRLALTKFMRPVRRDPGRPYMTWWSVIEKDLNFLNIEDRSIPNLASMKSDRDKWRVTTKF